MVRLLRLRKLLRTLALLLFFPMISLLMQETSRTLRPTLITPLSRSPQLVFMQERRLLLKAIYIRRPLREQRRQLSKVQLPVIKFSVLPQVEASLLPSTEALSKEEKSWLLTLDCSSRKFYTATQAQRDGREIKVLRPRRYQNPKVFSTSENNILIGK